MIQLISLLSKVEQDGTMIIIFTCKIFELFGSFI